MSQLDTTKKNDGLVCRIHKSSEVMKNSLQYIPSRIGFYNHYTNKAHILKPIKKYSIQI